MPDGTRGNYAFGSWPNRETRVIQRTRAVSTLFGLSQNTDRWLKGLTFLACRCLTVVGSSRLRQNRPASRIELAICSK